MVCLAGVVLCLVAAFAILYLKSPRVGMVQLWFADVLRALQALLLFFSLLTLVFKFFAEQSNGPGDPSE
ncbi:MAG TPA: hypothetical protein VGS07_29330 [Thermoanaerobaculia bacterium]|nr:hypothetical protein [Thermoanaerobaculia bacterium]